MVRGVKYVVKSREIGIRTRYVCILRNVAQSREIANRGSFTIRLYSTKRIEHPQSMEFESSIYLLEDDSLSGKFLTFYLAAVLYQLRAVTHKPTRPIGGTGVQTCPWKVNTLTILISWIHPEKNLKTYCQS